MSGLFQTLTYFLLCLALMVSSGLAAGVSDGKSIKALHGSSGAGSDIQLAQKQQFKYEVPKAPRVAPKTAPAPKLTAPSAPSTRSVPRKSAPSTRKLPSTGGGGGGPRIQIGPFGLGIGRGGGGGGGSCEGCRNSCYNSYHGTKKFVPCMRNCWYKYCRR